MPRATGHQPETSSERKKWFRIRPLYIVLLVAMGLFGYKFLQKTQEIKRLSAQAAALQAQNDQIAQQNAQIARSKLYYQTDQYVENAARSTLGLTKPGETEIVSQPVTPPVLTMRQAPPRPLPPPLPSWQQWWNSFFG